jgi:hypothetical protein
VSFCLLREEQGASSERATTKGFALLCRLNGVIENGATPKRTLKWRGTVDEDGHYSCAVAL